MSRQRWTSPIVACAVAALVWSCARGTSAPGAAPSPAPAAPTAPSVPRPPAATPPAAAPASDMRSTQSGVYADEQAMQGKDVYAGQCVSCHSGDHIGGKFRRQWAGKPLSNMYSLIVETMPQDNPGSLSREDYVRVIAYLLKANGMPAGETPLPTDSLALSKIRLDTLVTR